MITVGEGKATLEQVKKARERGLTILGVDDDGRVYVCSREEFETTSDGFKVWASLTNSIMSDGLRMPIHTYHRRYSVMQAILRDASVSKPNPGFMALPKLNIKRISL